jgi:hypothetical protein
MATILETIRTLLYSDATVGGQVGSTLTTARIYKGGTVPQGVDYPFIQLETISDQKTHLLKGGKYVFQNQLVQVSAWDTTQGKARTLADNIINAIDGNLTLPMTAGVETDIFDSAAQVHQVSVDFRVMTAPL